MTEDNIVWWVASIIVGAGSVPLGLVIVLVWERIQKKLRPSNGSAVIHLRCAACATDLLPLIGGLARNGIPFRGSELWIFGCDGRYIVNKRGGRWRGGRWCRVFRKWTKKGLIIKYLLLEVDGDVKAELGKLKNDLGDNFEAFVLERKHTTQDVARKLETFHPTLFLGKDGNNAAWIEGLHRRNSIYAYNVDYISPSVIAESETQRERFESCDRDLKWIHEHSTRLVFA